MKLNNIVAIIGGGNIGLSIAEGLLKSEFVTKDTLILTRRRPEILESYKNKGILITKDNADACLRAGVIIIAVQPRHLDSVLQEIKSVIKKGHIVISVVSGAEIKDIREILGKKASIVRAMPNTAISIQESMTCLSSDSEDALKTAKAIFDNLGQTLVINEDLMVPATALCACGIAFFLRAIRAASQGGIEIGFHSEEALVMAAQTAKGAAALILTGKTHPESEVDKVTTPRGCTISGLNQMEHNGFSSAMIKGIVSSADKAAKLYSK